MCSTASSTYYQINGARLVLVASSAIYMSHVVVILPAAGAAGEIITTSKDFGKYVFLHFSTGPVARADGDRKKRGTSFGDQKKT